MPKQVFVCLAVLIHIKGNGIVLQRRFITAILGALIFLVTGISITVQAASQVIIVKSSDNAYFDQTIRTLASHVDPATRFRVVEAPHLADVLSSPDPHDLFVALGQSAVEAVDRLGTEVSSINAYITLEQYQHLQPDDDLTIVLDQPMYRYLAFCKLILGIESVGIIEESEIDLGREQAQILDEFKLQLNQYRVNQANKLLPVLRQLLRQNDALLMLPRQSIYNRDTLKGVLLSSYRNRKPAISYSPAHVKSGAVASIFSSPVDIGRHLAHLLNQALNDQASADNPLEFPRFYTIATNLRVANALGIDLPGEHELRSRIDGLQP